MPRQARLDVAEVLQHVMARGIEGRDIFRDTKDREAFLKRLSDLVAKGNVQLLAWSLMPNHFHLLLRTHEMSLSTLMRRLMTGYAVWHNRRHERKGHLFQNRYKSIVVEEEPYFLELVRYIHLNPVRAKILDSVSRLDRYPYTGHAVLMGYHEFRGQDISWVLGRFGKRKGPARQRYRAFIEKSFNQGAREDLRGGGLIRSAGGREQLALGSKEEWEKGDERILGGGDFVQEILRSRTERKEERKLGVAEILKGVSKDLNMPQAKILSGARSRSIARARRAFLLRAHEEAGASMAELGRLCGLTHSAVRQAVEKARAEEGKKQQNYQK
jgi:putative transposase